ncbi:hypothetical protein [Nocardioides zeae]|uniref:Uncharacterized protein n=1 Tax=Nocardioides zeae TaxID=1457234 RepID=A0A6P0HN94_9ACTN|nr:hypothetical protein [Nocardioides zeae]NEN80101.1 hypothetical protein [Nocardioides zeae]
MIPALRRCAAARLLPLLLVVAAGVVLSRGTPWLGEPSWTVARIAGSVIILGPVVAGLAAMDAARWNEEQLTATLRALPRSAVARWHVVLANAAVGVAVLLVVQAAGYAANVAVGVGYVASPGSALLLVLGGGAVLVGSAAVGALVGLLWGSVLAAPLAAAGLYGLALLALSLDVPALFAVIGGANGMVGLRAATSAFVALVGFHLFLTVAVLAAYTLRDGVVRRRVAGPVLGAGTAGAVAVAAVLVVTDPDQVVIDDRPVAWTCAGTEPRVCLPRESPRQLDWLAAEMHELAEPLVAAGATVPATYRLEVPGQRRDLAEGSFAPLDTGRLTRPAGDPQEVAVYLSTPAPCAAYSDPSGPPPAIVHETREVLRVWLLVRNGLADPADFRTAGFGPWLAAPLEEQESWVRTTYEQLRSCELDRLTPPVAPAG